MTDLLLDDNQQQNVDDLVNNDNLGVKKAEIDLYHWTQLKLTNSACEREMIFADVSSSYAFSGGLTKSISCVLSSGQTGQGETAKVRFVQFDHNYLKFQVATLLRDVIFECCNSPEADFEIIHLKQLLVGAIEDFCNQAEDLIDNSLGKKAIKPKDVTVALKQKYSNTEV